MQLRKLKPVAAIGVSSQFLNSNIYIKFRHQNSNISICLEWFSSIIENSNKCTLSILPNVELLSIKRFSWSSSVCRGQIFLRKAVSRCFLMIILITAQKMKFPIKYFFSKCDQTAKLQIWSHLLKKSLTDNCGFCAVKWFLAKFFILFNMIPKLNTLIIVCFETFFKAYICKDVFLKKLSLLSFHSKRLY